MTFPKDWAVLRWIRRALLDPPGRSRDVHALKAVDLTIEQGVILGLLGPKGAGKSTLLRLVAGVLTPTQGQVRAHGLDPVADKARLSGRTGYLMRQRRSFSRTLSGEDNLRFFAGLHGMSHKEGAGRARELIDAVGLTPIGDTPVRNYSADMRQRLSVARALLSDPELLIMDEATSGLDPDQRSNFYGFLLDHTRLRGCTVLYATHDLNEAQFLCHQVALMDQGSLVAKGSYLDVQKTAVEIFARAGEDAEAASQATSLYPGQIEDRSVDRITQEGRW